MEERTVNLGGKIFLLELTDGTHSVGLYIKRVEIENEVEEVLRKPK